MALVGAPTPRRHIIYGSSQLIPAAGLFLNIILYQYPKYI